MAQKTTLRPHGIPGGLRTYSAKEEAVEVVVELAGIIAAQSLLIATLFNFWSNRDDSNSIAWSNREDSNSIIWSNRADSNSITWENV